MILQQRYADKRTNVDKKLEETNDVHFAAHEVFSRIMIKYFFSVEEVKGMELDYEIEFLCVVQ